MTPFGMCHYDVIVWISTAPAEEDQCLDITASLAPPTDFTSLPL